MKSLDEINVPESTNINAPLVSNENREAHILFNKLEQTMICIHFTNAVDYCIEKSISDPYDEEGHFDMDGFYSGKYDTEFLLDKLYDDSKEFFEKYSDRYVPIDADIIDRMIEEYSKYEFSSQYKYLSLFVEYLNSKKLSK